LVEQRDSTATELLREALAAAKGNAVAATAQLQTLAVLGGLNEETLAQGLTSSHAGVRENAIQLAEPMLPKSERLRNILLKLARDPDSHVRFRCALALGEAGFSKRSDELPPPPELMISALAAIAARDSADRWTRAAILSSASGHEGVLLHALMSLSEGDSAGIAAITHELGRILGAFPPKLGFLTDRLRT